MYPHERSLVKRLENKPFVLLGVNSDTDRDQIKQRIKQENITWRSWWDAGSAPADGPNAGQTISQQWHIHGYPTIYVIDDKGVIRYQDVRGQALDDAVDHLLHEMGVTVEPHPPAPLQ
jgi:hypothetical protein